MATNDPAYMRKWHAKNKEKWNAYIRARCTGNAMHNKKHAEYMRKWRLEHPEYKEKKNARIRKG